MPFYDFKCPDCGKVYQELISMSELDSFVKVCDHCFQKLIRVFSVPPAIVNRLNVRVSPKRTRIM